MFHHVICMIMIEQQYKLCYSYPFRKHVVYVELIDKLVHNCGCNKKGGLNFHKKINQLTDARWY